jgi:cytochrome P450
MIDILYLQMAAGLDTVTASLDCLVARLAGDIDLQRQARASADERRQLIEELLRVDTPVQMVQRYAAKDMEMHGIHIAAGDMVMLLIGAANTDESAFTDAMRVDPTRDNTRHMAFGGGIHRCLGSHLARLELTVAFDEIFAAFGEFRLADGRQADFMPGIRTAKSLPLQWQTRTARATTAR